MIILFAFSGILTTMLTIPRFESRIDTFDELVEDGRMRLTIEEDVVFAKQFLVASCVINFKRVCILYGIACLLRMLRPEVTK